MQQLFDKEATIRCACGDAHHFIHLGFWYPFGMYQEYNQELELCVASRLVHGSLWKRIKLAIKLIFSGWVEYDFDVYVDRDGFYELVTFLNECKALHESKEK